MAALRDYVHLACMAPPDSQDDLPSIDDQNLAIAALAVAAAHGRAAAVRWLGGQSSKPRAPVQDVDLATAVAARCSELDVACVVFGQPDYPPWLAAIPDPPAVLFVRGALAGLHGSGVGIVGARRCTRYGSTVARNLAADLGRSGLVVFSGLALGIDSAAHVGALDAGATTVAVLGCGLARRYPRRNGELAERVVGSGGALVSEYPPDVPPLRHHFPERNRIISGLSRAVIIVEATEKSGSLITARMAAEQGRDVLVVPGPVTGEKSAGCHRLIRQGAGLIRDAEDVLAELDLPPAPAAESRGASDHPGDGQLSDVERRVLAVLDVLPAPTDQIVADSGLEPADVTAALVRLQLTGFVDAASDGYIRRPQNRR